MIAIISLTTLSTRAAETETGDIQTNHPPKTGEQVFVLPQDEGKLYLTVYGDPSDERYQQVKKWFNENAELKAIRAQTHYAAIDTDSKLFKERYADEVTTPPCIRVVTPNGIELLNMDATAIPLSDKALNTGVRTGLMDRLFNGGRQKQKNESPQERMKRKVDEKIEDTLDNANLPPVTAYVMSKIAKVVIGGVFTIVIGIAFIIALFKVLREVRAAQQQ